MANILYQKKKEAGKHNIIKSVGTRGGWGRRSVLKRGSK